MKTIWTVGGHDPNAAAGIQADLLTANTLNVTCRTIIASFTAQSDRQVSLSEAVPSLWLKMQWDVLSAEEQPAAIKLGLLNHRDQLIFLRAALAAWPGVPVIADPVLASSSGHAFAEADLIASWRELLLPRLTLLTPNIPEAEWLLGYRIADPDTMIKAAAELRSWGLAAVLIKGGHLAAPHVPMDYFDDGHRAFWLAGKRVERNYRGTGCTLATAIAAEMSKGLALREAVVMAHAFLQDLLSNSASMGAPYLHYEKRAFPLPGLSFQQPGSRAAFPSIQGGRIGFYPIVADLRWMKKLVDLGVPSIQLRIKDADPETIAESIQQAVNYCRGKPVRLFINDYWQTAVDAGAYGVHLGQEDLDVLSDSDWDRLQKSGLRLGISTHSYEEAARALAIKPSYIALGPIFETTCKSMTFGPQGMERLQEWHALCPGIPLVAIGGLKLDHASTLLSYGASGLSVITDVLKAVDPDARTRAWLAVFPRN